MKRAINTKDLRAQFAEQIKCLDLKKDVDCAVINELNEFFRKRAALELDYSDNLVKLVNSLKQRHVSETSKLPHWLPYSTTTIWNTLVGTTLRISEAHATLGNVLCKLLPQRLADMEEDCVRQHKHCREMMYLFQQNVLSDVTKLQATLREYGTAQLNAAEADRQRLRAIDKMAAQTLKARTKGKDPNLSQSVLRAQNEYASKDLSYTSASVVLAQTRNNYLVQLAATNHSMTRYFTEEVSHVLDCLSCGFHNSLARSAMVFVSCEESLKTCHGSIVEMLNRIITALDWGEDKTRFLESNAQCFACPNAFVFLPSKDDAETQICATGVLKDQLEAGICRLSSEIEELRLSSESLWKVLGESEKKLLELINQKDYDVSGLFIKSPTGRSRTTGLSLTSAGSTSPISRAPLSQSTSIDTNAASSTATDTHCTRSHSFGGSNPSLPISDSNSSVCLFTQLRSATRDARIEQEKLYLDCFTKYTDAMHKCHVLQVKVAQMHQALALDRNTDRETHPPASNISKFGFRVLPPSSDSLQSPTSTPSAAFPFAKDQGSFSVASSLASIPTKVTCVSGLSSGPPTGSVSSATGLLPLSSGRRVLQVPNVGKPKVFGGTIDEYVEATNQPIPLVLLSCAQAIVKFGIRQRGLFRVSGSQTDVEEFKTAFEHGDDALALIDGSKDIHIVAGVFKLYFRKLSEPLFPTAVFRSIIDCTLTSSSSEDSACRVRSVIMQGVSKHVFIVMRFLFAFLSHVAEHSDENSMDAHNLAVCFAPSLMPIPNASNQVHYQNTAISVLTTLITHHQVVFDPLVAGPIYVKREVTDTEGSALPDILSHAPVSHDAIAALVGELSASCPKRNLRYTEHAGDMVKSSETTNDVVDRTSPSDVPFSPNDGDAAMEKESDNSADELRSISDSEASELPCLVAVAQADFVGSSPRELSFRKGDALYLYRKLSEHWWEGQLCSDTTGQQRGLVPQLYMILKGSQVVQSDEDVIDDSLSDPTQLSIHSRDTQSVSETPEVNAAAMTSSEPDTSGPGSGVLEPGHATAHLGDGSQDSKIPASEVSTEERILAESRNPPADESCDPTGLMTKSTSSKYSPGPTPADKSNRTVVLRNVGNGRSFDSSSPLRHTTIGYPTGRQLRPLPENEVVSSSSPNPIARQTEGGPAESASPLIDTYSNCDLESQLAEVIHSLNCLERADSHVNDFQSLERTRELRRKLQLPSAKHTPDLVLDLPFSGGSTDSNSRVHRGGSSSVRTQPPMMSSADNFAEQGQDTVRKRSEPVVSSPGLARSNTTTGVRLRPLPPSETPPKDPPDSTQPPPASDVDRNTMPVVSESEQKLLSIAARVAAFEGVSQSGVNSPRPRVAPKPRPS